MRLFLILAILMAACPSVCLGEAIVSDPLNGGFEQGLSGWTSTCNDDGTNWGYRNEFGLTSDYHHSGDSALWGKTTIVGDNGNPKDPGTPWEGSGRDWSCIDAWSDPSDVTDVVSIQLSLTDFQFNPNHFGWGYGQQVWLTLSDGVNTLRALLLENHEQPYSIPQPYSTSVGSDGRTWRDYDVDLTEENFPGLGGINKMSTMVGICWEADSWYSTSQTLWSGAAVDDIRLIQNSSTPEPGTAIFLSVGVVMGLAFGLCRRK